MSKTSKPQATDKYSSACPPEEWLHIEPVLTINQQHVGVYANALLQAMTRPSIKTVRCITFTIELTNHQTFNVVEYCADLPGVEDRKSVV